MFSIDDGKGNPTNSTNSNAIIASDTETQSPSSSSGEEDEEQQNDWNAYEGEAVPLWGETQVLDFDEETQKLDFWESDDENVTTQLLDDPVRTQLLDESDGEGTDKTEVLSDGDDEDGFGEGYVVDSDASADTHCDYAVRAASLRPSGQTAAQSMITRETNNGGSPSSDNLVSDSKHLGEDDGTDDLQGPLSLGIEVVKVDADNNLHNNDRNMRGYNDKIKCDDAQSTGRLSIDEDLSTEDNGLEDDNNCYFGETERLESPAYDHEYAGLSYVGSQEPGEFSQANALDFVDRFLAVNQVELSQEDGCGKTFKECFPSVSLAKGTQCLAKSSGIKCPARDVNTFNWVDGFEDEECRRFYDEREGAITKSRFHDQRPLTRSQKAKKVKTSKGKCKPSKPMEKDNENLHTKIMSSSYSDTGVALHNAEQSDKLVQTSEMSIIRNLSNDFEEQLNAESPDKSLESIGAGIDLSNVYDVGCDTQMAAEAMEALCHAVPPKQDTDNLYQVSENATSDFPRGVANREALTEHVSSRKRISSATVATGKRSKRRRKTCTEVDNSNYIISSKDLKAPQRTKPGSGSLVKDRPMKSKSKAEEHSSSGIDVNGKEYMGRRSSKSGKYGKTTSTIQNLHNKDYGGYGSLSMSNNNLEVRERQQEDPRSFSPIACRTRRSKVVKPLGGLDLPNGSGVENDLADVNICRAKRRGLRSGVDAPVTLTTKGKKDKPGPSQIAKVRKGKFIQLEPPRIGGAQEERVRNDKCCLLSSSRVKRASQKMSGSLKSNGHEDLCTVAGGLDIHGQNIPRRKRSSVAVRSSARAKPSVEWGKKLATTSLLASGAKRNDMLQIISGDKESPSADCITSINCANSLNTPPPICLGQKSLSGKAAPLPAFKESRKMRDMTGVRVLLSHHLDESIIKQQKKISSRLGLSIVSSSSEATHFIADKFVRTRNMLEAIAFGKPVVTHLWLESCGKANSFIDEKNFILRDSEKEKELGFSMPVSLARARNCHSQLLQGKRIFVTPNVKPSREIVASLVKAVHGQVVKTVGRSSMKGDTVSDDLLVLSCEEDYATCLPLLLKRAAVYSSELLLNGIVLQKLEYERYRLFKDCGRKDHIKRVPKCD